jgi:hypothetical protein
LNGLPKDRAGKDMHHFKAGRIAPNKKAPVARRFFI